MPSKKHQDHPQLKANQLLVKVFLTHRRVLQVKLSEHPFSPDTYLTEWDNEATQVLLLAGEADVICGHKHLPQNVHFVKGCPEGAVCVAVQFFIFGQPEKCTVSLALGPGIKVTGKQ